MKILLEEFQMNKFFFQKKVTFKGSLYNTKYLYAAMAAYYFLLHPKLQSCKDKKDTELIDCVQQILYRRDSAVQTKMYCTDCSRTKV